MVNFKQLTSTVEHQKVYFRTSSDTFGYCRWSQCKTVANQEMMMSLVTEFVSIAVHLSLVA